MRAKPSASMMTPRQLKLGSLPRCLLSRWELRSDCGIRGALTLGIRGYHEGVALQKAGREPDNWKKILAGQNRTGSTSDKIDNLRAALLSFSIPVKFPLRNSK